MREWLKRLLNQPDGEYAFENYDHFYLITHQETGRKMIITVREEGELSPQLQIHLPATISIFDTATGISASVSFRKGEGFIAASADTIPDISWLDQLGYINREPEDPAFAFFATHSYAGNVDEKLAELMREHNINDLKAAEYLILQEIQNGNPIFNFGGRSLIPSR